MKHVPVFLTYLLILLVTILLCSEADAGVPVRISIKFILDGNGNLPEGGNLNTDEEVIADYTAATDILNSQYSEFTIDVIEFVDLPGVSEWFYIPAISTDPNNKGYFRDALRAAAIADKARFLWRENAVNVYINGGTSSAISDFPPNNNIIFMNQGCANTPSCILHEMGHTLSLAHTHETTTADGDYCDDTIADNKDWTKNQVAQNNFGCLFADCTPVQQEAVALTYNNVMSYHVDEPQTRFSPCQMNRISSQCYYEQDRLLSKQPAYINPVSIYPAYQDGSYFFPYLNLQYALDFGIPLNKVVVLQQGTHSMRETFVDPLEMITRFGPSTVVRQGAQTYMLPVNFGNSKHPKVRAAAKRVQDEDTAQRKIARNADEAEKKVSKREEKAAIRADAKARRKPHQDNAQKGLLDAEQYAEGDEKLAIQMELAQRYRDSGDCKRAVEYFTRVADTTDQPGLKQAALLQVSMCGKGAPAGKR